jgi:NAD(P)-dependent dehydrogenase (short-subunit alcohol dehydrogenase family)
MRRMSKVALVTGGGRGIGAATCRLLAREGYAVCVNFLKNASAAEALARELPRAIAVGADVAEERDVLRLFDAVEQQLGPLDLLVNNAGVVDLAMPLRDMEFARMQRIFATNVLGAMLCAREAARRMRGRGGAIVNISTGFVKSGAPGMMVDYAASKGAIEVFTAGLARELAAEGIRVNAVRPGVIDTEIHADTGDAARASKAHHFVPMKRAGQAEEVARAIVWLASEAASYTTGTVLDVTGGI